MTNKKDLPKVVKQLSPIREKTLAKNAIALATEQMIHFGISPETQIGKYLQQVIESIYVTGIKTDQLISAGSAAIAQIQKSDHIAHFNAKKFICFQLAKLIDQIQPGMKVDYQRMGFEPRTQAAKGQHPLFTNVGVLFSATPPVIRTATYLYACTAWVDDAFRGQESTHAIYSRLLNPTSMALASYITELEAGANSASYMAWNFNSGMSAIENLLSHLLCHGDILIISRNVYGGVHQLVQDYFAKSDKMAVRPVWFDGYDLQDFERTLQQCQAKYKEALASGSKIITYLESPCNPHGYVADISGISRMAHQHNIAVIVDSTLATPFLQQPLQHSDPEARPDYIIHSYTKDISGNGTVTGGVVIGQNHHMFIPKGQSVNDISWENTLFWNVYYIKGGFLSADSAIEIYNGAKTLESRMISKAINTLIITHFLDAHPLITVNSHALQHHENYALKEKSMHLGLPCSLFTIHFEKARIPYQNFVQFFDALDPAFSHMVSLGQTNTLVLCPALTSHSELSGDALKQAGISATTIRISVGDEHPADLIHHFIMAAKRHIEPVSENFCDSFLTEEELNKMIRKFYLKVHGQYIDHTLEK